MSRKCRHLRFLVHALFLFSVAIASTLSLQAQTQTIYTPALRPAGGGELGFSLVNPTLANVDLTLTARAYDGSLLLNNQISNPVTLSLTAGSQKTLSAMDVFGAGISGQDGWVELSDPSGSVKGFFLLYDAALTFVDGAEFSTLPSNRLVFANVSVSTKLTLVNTSPEAVSGLVYLYRNDGELAATGSITLSSLSGFAGSVKQLVPSSANGFTGYAVVETASRNGAPQNVLIAMETYRNSADIAVVRGLPDSATLRSGYLAHLVSQGGYSSMLTLVNTSDKPQLLRIRAEGLEVNGQARIPSAVTVERTLPPHARRQESVNGMFGLTGSALITGHIRFETLSETRGVIALMDIGTTDGVVLAAIEAQSAGYSDFYFLHVAENDDFGTGMILLNANNEPAIVTITAFDRSGQPLESTVVNLAPGERESRVLADLFQHPVSQASSYVRITATRPILALELFESRNLSRFLASVPAQGVNLIPQASGRRVIASQGAHVLSDDSSASLLIPPKALKSDTAIRVTPLNTASLPSPAANLKAISRVEGLPAGTQFQIPVRLTFALDVDLAPGMRLPLLIYEPATGQYQTTAFVATVDNSGRTASAEVTHFTEYVASLDTGGDLLQIFTINPSLVSIGSTVTISGTDFSLTGNTVTFAGPSNTSIPATVLSATTTTLQAVVPSGAVSGPVVVRVGNRSSNGVIVTVLSPNPAPGTIYVTPATMISSSPWVDLLVSGTSFVSSSVVNYDSSPLPTTFVNSTLLTVRLSGSLLNPGLHHVDVFTPAPGGGTSNVADVTVTTPNQPPTVNAGTDQTITLPASAALNGTASDDGLPTGSTLTTAWSKVSGPGTVTFANIAASSTTASFSAAGVYLLRLTATDSALFTTDDISIIVNGVNRAPTVNAGPDQTIALPATTTLNGTVSDDGLPLGSTLITTWYQLSGPGPVALVNTSVPSTTASFPSAGTYVLRLRATDGALSVIDDISIVVGGNQPPTVNAGPDQTITLPAAATLNGTASDDGLPSGSTLSTTWSKVSGPGTVTFGNITARITTVSFSIAGSYVLRLTATDGALTATNNATIVVNAGTTNQAPVVNAGPDQTITLPAAATLNGTASDDGLPSGSTLSTTWSKVSGPGTVTFANITARITTVSFSVAGSYVLRLTATDSALTATNDATIVVNAGTTNQAPVVNAGPDQTITFPAAATLNGTASDDGLPSGSTLSTTWSKISGPGTVTFGNIAARSTTAIFSAAGTYVLRLTATDGALSATDNLTVVANIGGSNQAPAVNAGPDQVITLPASATLNGTASDDGLPSGSTLSTTWSKVSGPGTVTFGNIAARNTTASFSVAGSYVLRLTATDSILSANDSMTIVVNPSGSTTGNSVVAGAITLSSTFDNIGVRAKFSGDPNGNATGQLRFRQSGQAVWHDAFTPIVDGRPTIGGIVNPHAFESRGSIVGLTPGTTYEVEFTWIDPDGVYGNATSTGFVTTIAASAPVSGRQLFVDDVTTNGNGSSISPFNSIPNALNAAISGDTIFVRAGTYPRFAVSKSGTASGYIAIVGESRDQVLISGGTGNNIDIVGSYIQLKNLRLKQSSHSSIEIKNASHHVWIENLYHENISSSFSYNDSGVLVRTGAHNVYVLNNLFYSQSLTNYTYPGARFDSPGAAVYFNGIMNPKGTFVVKGNVIDGGFRDCIGNSPESWGGGTMDNSDIAYNTIMGCKDDSIQMEGDDVNLRIYGNDVTTNNGYASIAMQSNFAGPAYVFRNTLRVNWTGAAGYAFKLGGEGYGFYFHNTVDTTGSSQRNDGFAYAGPNQFVYNNILKASGNPIYGVAAGGKYNANLYLPRSPTFPVVSHWAGNTSYLSVTSFRNGTGNEQNGLQGDPLFLDAAKRINSSSPAFDAGILIPNFNSPDSAWPYAGAAPDIGVYEVGGVVP